MAGIAYTYNSYNDDGTMKYKIYQDNYVFGKIISNQHSTNEVKIEYNKYETSSDNR